MRMQVQPHRKDPHRTNYRYPLLSDRWSSYKPTSLVQIKYCTHHHVHHVCELIPLVFTGWGPIVS